MCQGGSAAAEAQPTKLESAEPEGKASDAGVPTAATKAPTKGEQIPGRKGVSSKLDAIREKYNPGEEIAPSPQRW